MVRRKRITWVSALSFALIVLAVIAPGLSSAAPAESAPAAAVPDFWFWLSYDTQNWSDPSYVVRGDTSAYPGPKYALASYSGWFWANNSLILRSRNGFTGNVNIEVLNLPLGITAEMPATVFVPRFGAGPTISVKLRASAATALGDVSGVTLRGTSGSIVHTVVLPTFTVVDQLPPFPG